MRYRRLVTAADPIVANSATPVPASERVAALDVLRGFALLGIFIMNMPGFSHSLFATPAMPSGVVDALVAGVRELFFAGKFNLLFGLAFGIGFALQTARLGNADATQATNADAFARPSRVVRIYVRRLAFLLVVGLVHARLLWSGDVLLVYALLGFVLLALRRLGDHLFMALIAACLVFPALAEVLRPTLFAAGEAVAAFEYQQFVVADDLAYGHGSFLDAVRETARIFDWSWRSPLGLFTYASFFVQMATGTFVGFILGRRGWPARPIASAAAERRAPWSALAVAMGCAVIEPIAFVAIQGNAGVFVSMLARTIGRASLAACYALVVVRVVRDRPVLPMWLRLLRDAGRMPLSNYLLQTAMASFVFYGWGLGWWNAAGPMRETVLALALFVFVQLPLSSAWLARFRYGPLEYAWRRFTYGARAA
jgi:uncharacterized protein